MRLGIALLGMLVALFVAISPAHAGWPFGGKSKFSMPVGSKGPVYSVNNQMDIELGTGRTSIKIGQMGNTTFRMGSDGKLQTEVNVGGIPIRF